MSRDRFLALLGACLVLLLAGCEPGDLPQQAVTANAGVQATLTAAALPTAPEPAQQPRPTPAVRVSALAPGWTWYSNADMDFSAGVPEKWIAEPQPPGNGAAARTVTFAPPPDDVGQGVARIMVMSNPLPAGAAPVSAADLRQQAEGWAKAQNLSLVEPTQTAEVSGWPAVRMTLDADSADRSQTLRAHGAFVATDRSLFYVEAAGLPAHAGAVRSVFEAFLGSFLSPAGLLDPALAGPAAVPAPGETPSPKATGAPSATPSPAAAIEARVKAQPFLNIREGPGKDFAKIRAGGLPAGTAVTLLGRAVTKQPWVKVHTAGGETGWVSANPAHLSYDVELSALPHAFYRPPTGIVDAPGKRSGRCEFGVTNAGSSDGLIVLARDQAAFVAAFVRAGESLQIPGVPDGEYPVFYTLGSDWDGSGFNRDVRRARLDEFAKFQTTAAGVSCAVLTIQTTSGNTGSQAVEAAGFPAVVSDIAGQ